METENTKNNTFSNTSNIWSFFDKIYCINLYEREDRYLESKQLFNELNINNLEYYRTYKHKKGGKYGCFESHINVINKAYNSGTNNCLIFEDDVYPLDFSYVGLLECVNFMQNNKEWNIFYLGGFPNIYYDQNKNTTPHFYKTHSIGCHAYVINRNLMNIVKDWKYNGIEIDNILCKMENSYTYYKPLFYQKASKSDIGNRLWDDLRFDGIKKGVFRFLYYYSYYFGYSIKKVLLVFIILILILIIKYGK